MIVCRFFSVGGKNLFAAPFGRGVHLPVREKNIRGTAIGCAAHVIGVTNPAIGKSLAFGQLRVVAAGADEHLGHCGALGDEQAQGGGGVGRVFEEGEGSVVRMVNAQGQINFLKIGLASGKVAVAGRGIEAAGAHDGQDQQQRQDDQQFHERKPRR